ncbi:contractile injection system protein, VgrG/Pvc8 family [uncultured Tateyamaria sp.]|uniref:phage late control D family protein n=1 Tax=uncultured Tateyamaria sp. TaxID=455651 RepID=UPI00261D8E33|nr:contractile injection system protein, VgrG/Pvc8 family [uncultured Tateyamaria sp.]
MGVTDFRPLVRVRIDGQLVSGFLFSQLTSVRVTDTAGLMSDTAELTFANASAIQRFAMPEPGAEVEIELGYLGEFKHMGVYIADEVEESSPPRQISVSCRAKSQGSTESGYAPIHQQKTRSWDEGLTLEQIVKTVAGDNGLEPAITDAAASIVPGHIDQIDESDLAMLTRIAVTHDLVAKPAGGTLFVGKKADGIKASGEATPTVRVLETDVSRWAMRRSQGEATGSVIATYRDLGQGADIEVQVGEGEPIRRLRQRFRSEAEAAAAASAEARRSGRMQEAFELEMPGDPSIVAEGKIEPIGFSSACSGTWLVETANHEVSVGAYVTLVQATRPE